MHTLLLTLMIISGILLIALVLVQRSQGDGLSEAITGGAEQLFSKQKQGELRLGSNG
ncbi:preprotein translocase subunit SecG [Sporolactobacillus inulinus]|uniref:Protein-export membrane protein SecG n=1 Tax=Sporolactobacillus inulinus TaxID=2078 RepID=A0A4Y1ZFS3_9BACL|nr:preprotein translocase subunit SecG [Sporolactobacillus inulinus]